LHSDIRGDRADRGAKKAAQVRGLACFSTLNPEFLVVFRVCYERADVSRIGGTLSAVAYQMIKVLNKKLVIVNMHIIMS
jgi:hypothetical protein